MDKNTAMFNWLMQCPNVKHLYALFGDIEDGGKHLYRQPDSVKTQRKYVDGGRFEQICSDWQLLCFDSVAYNWQPPQNNENLTEYENAQAICDWIEIQRKNKHYPEFNETVEDIESVPTNPQILGVDVTTGMAKIAVGIRVTFKGKLS